MKVCVCVGVCEFSVTHKQTLPYLHVFEKDFLSDTLSNFDMTSLKSLILSCTLGLSLPHFHNILLHGVHTKASLTPSI